MVFHPPSCPCKKNTNSKTHNHLETSTHERSESAHRRQRPLYHSAQKLRKTDFSLSDVYYIRRSELRAERRGICGAEAILHVHFKRWLNFNDTFDAGHITWQKQSKWLTHIARTSKAYTNAHSIQSHSAHYLGAHRLNCPKGRSLRGV